MELPDELTIVIPQGYLDVARRAGPLSFAFTLGVCDALNRAGFKNLRGVDISMDVSAYGGTVAIRDIQNNRFHRCYRLSEGAVWFLETYDPTLRADKPYEFTIEATPLP